jgi:hypothetical protein
MRPSSTATPGANSSCTSVPPAKSMPSRSPLTGIAAAAAISNSRETAIAMRRLPMKSIWVPAGTIWKGTTGLSGSL